MATLVLALFLMGLSSLAERLVAKPLRRLAVIIHRLNECDLAVHIPFGERRDEIGEIARLLQAFKSEMIRSRRLWRREFALMEASIDAIVVVDREGRVTQFNTAAEHMFGISRTGAAGIAMNSLVTPPYPGKACGPGPDFDPAGADATVLGRRIETQGWRDGASFPVELTLMPAEEEGETIFVAYIRDITEHRQREAELRKLVVGLEHNPSAIMITDVNGHIEYVNPAFVATSGYSREEVLGRHPRMLRSGNISDETYGDMWTTTLSGRTWKGQFSSRRKNGDAYWQFAVVSPVKDETDRITNFFVITEDVTARKEAEFRLEHQARYDRLTGLPNRTTALQGLAQLIAIPTPRRLGVLAVNMDSLSKINERFGIEIGDLVLLEFSHRLAECVGERGQVARLEGGTFLVLMPGLAALSPIESQAQQILESGRFTYSVAGAEAFLTCRVGIAVFPMDGNDASTLVREAHVALQRAKLSGGNGYHFFSTGMDEEAAAVQRIDSALRRGMERGEFRLVYQPIFAAATGKPAVVEALLRWTSADVGEIGPDRFIPLAEQNGLIRPLGEWVLREACRQAAGWADIDGDGVVVAVNVSPSQFAETGFADRIGGILAETGLPPHRLEIEVTERLLVGQDDRAAQTVEALKRRNLRLSIDDFGTGYSALSYLSRYDFHTLKIDRSFIGKMTISDKDLALVETIIAMAHSMKIQVIAEGVETEEQLETLRRLRCDLVQGYLLARPLEADAIDGFLASLTDMPSDRSPPSRPPEYDPPPCREFPG